MEPLGKTLFCSVLKTDVNVTYSFGELLNRDGTVKKKFVKYFECEFKDKCGMLYDPGDCVCLKEARKVELSVNGL